MIDVLKPYFGYKDCDVPRLVEVPDHLEVRRRRNGIDMRVSNASYLVTVELIAGTRYASHSV